MNFYESITLYNDTKEEYHVNEEIKNLPLQKMNHQNKNVTKDKKYFLKSQKFPLCLKSVFLKIFNRF